MAMTQMQLIQSLGEAMAWFERELQWGVDPAELRHLSGRIGELYAAVISNGQMANKVNQRGYDVVGSNGERISVKTTTMMENSGHVSFNVNTLDLVDRIIIFRINTSEMQVEALLDATTHDAVLLMAAERSGRRDLALSKLSRPRIRNSSVVRCVEFEGLTIRELEDGSIEVEREGKLILPSKPTLRDLAARLNLSIVNGNGNPLNTRALGNVIINTIDVHSKDNGNVPGSHQPKHWVNWPLGQFRKSVSLSEEKAKRDKWKWEINRHFKPPCSPSPSFS